MNSTINFHSLTIEESFRILKSSPSGLSGEDSRSRLNKYGLNILQEKKKISKFSILFNQFRSFLILLLIIATIISLILGEFLDALVIFIVILINALLGFLQEYKAEKSIEALKKLTNPTSIVLRGNKEVKIQSSNLVPGDILILSTGDKIPADCRLIEVYSLSTQEASLTGESTPVSKKLEPLSEKTAIANQNNSIFAGTSIINGRGKAIVYSTAMNTQIGKIAKLVDDVVDDSTPLQKKLKKLGEVIGILSIATCAIVFILLILTTQNIITSLIVAISLAVAAVPEGLPAVVTISLALGVQRMVKKNSLIRRLPAVETLGNTSVIASDKTGTITKNEMMVKQIYVDKKIINITGSGYEPFGSFLYQNIHFKSSSLDLVLKIGLLCNTATLNFDKKYTIFGDPTEGALIVSAEKYGIKKGNLEKIYPKLDEIPFDSEKKRMVTINQGINSKIAFMKGAPDVIIKFCTSINENGKTRKLQQEDIKNILNINEQMARDALRVLGFAYRDFKNKYQENNFVFVGLQGMIDPPRPGVEQQIIKCKQANIKVVMITGDHKDTACAIAKQIGLNLNAITGEELDKLNDEELTKIIYNYDIFARVNPEHKIKIVTAFQKRGNIVAVTGDGVNDAPALKKADIGIAMGITGTDVAKEASDMILLDDNFNSVVAAVEEGRGIYDNIQKFVNYLLSSNIAEVLIITLALIIGLPLPLIAIQILFLNLLTDSLPAVALGIDPPSKNIMLRKPKKQGDQIIDKKLAVNLIISALIITVITLLIYNQYNITNIEKAQTMAFTSLVVFEFSRLFSIRSEFKIPWKSSYWVYLAVSFAFILQLIIIYTPLNIYLKTIPLDLIDWLIISSSAVFIYGIGRLVNKIINLVYN